MINDITQQQFDVGSFGDLRRKATGTALFRSIIEKGTLIIRRLGGNRAQQIRFQRFLWSDAVTLTEMKKEALNKTSKLVSQCEHVLCLQDSTEIDLSRRKNDIETSQIGILKNRDETGFYFHPVLAMDARDDFIFGLSSIIEYDYGRPRAKLKQHLEALKPVEEKRSYRWISCAEESKQTLDGAKMVTIIGDRENDFYEYFARVPSSNFHILVRSKGERTVSDIEQNRNRSS